MKTITQEQLKEAADKFPMPGYVYWYQFKFPARQIAFIGAGFVLIGILFSAIKAGKIHLLSVTLQFTSLVVWLCTMLFIAILKKKRTFRKRANYLGISLQEYMSYEWNN